MKQILKFTLLSVVVTMALSISSSAQDCRAATMKLTDGAATISARTGGCVKYRFVIASGQRARVTLSSTDGKARFDLQDGAEDETGSTFYENQVSLDRVLEFEEFTIEVRGTSGTGFTVNVKVSDQ